jgi:hypothetical protein
MISSLFYFGVLFLSFLGWGLLASHRLKLHQAVIPLFVFSGITAVLFAAGLVNIMPHFVLLIFKGGLALSLFYFYLSVRKKIKWASRIAPATVVFFLSSVFILLSLKGIIHTHYDDFSHWGLIVKEMFQVGGLPDGRTIITFTNYPPGSATFIYYVLSIVGYAESYTFMAQGFLIAAALSVLFLFAQWNRPGGILLAFVIALAMLSINSTYIYTLLVDSLLGMVALAITIIAFYYRKDWRKSVLANTPILLLLILIKDSGKLFFLVNVMVIVGFALKYQIKGRVLQRKNVRIAAWMLLFIFIVPVTANFLWGQYVDKAYQENNYNKFAVNRSKLLDIKKSDELIQNLGPMVYQAATNTENSGIKSLLILNVLAAATVLYYLFAHKRLAKRLIAAAVFTNAVYLFYMLSLYLMYLFLMPENEAVRLAGFNRYLATIVVYGAGVMMMALYKEWLSETNRSRYTGVNAAVVLALGITFFYPFSDNMNAIVKNRPDAENTIRWGIKDQYQRIINEGGKGSQVFYYSPKSVDDRGYLDFVLRFEQTNRNFTVLRSLDTEEEEISFLARVTASDYVVLVDEDKRSAELLEGFLTKKSSSGVYRVNAEEGKVALEPVW